MILKHLIGVYLLLIVNRQQQLTCLHFYYCKPTKSLGDLRVFEPTKMSSFNLLHTFQSRHSRPSLYFTTNKPWSVFIISLSVVSSSSMEAIFCGDIGLLFCCTTETKLYLLTVCNQKNIRFSFVHKPTVCFHYNTFVYTFSSTVFCVVLKISA